MILKGVSRKDGGQLATYLLSGKNEQVRVVDIQGTVVATCDEPGLRAALRDMDEYGKMTRADKPLFHLALNPAQGDRLKADDWRRAVERAETTLGMAGHARVVVSHTYRGKEHYHVVWSRVDVERRRCVPLSHCNLKLCSLARALEIELGLQRIPDRARGEHQLRRELKTRAVEIEKFKQERASHTPDQLRALVLGAWSRGVDGREFQSQLAAVGLRLVSGKRGPLVLDANRESHSPARLLAGVRAGDVAARCADVIDSLPIVERARTLGKTEIVPIRASTMVQAEVQRHIANDVMTEQIHEIAL